MENNGRLFEFQNAFYSCPKRLGFADVLQIGELSLLPGYKMPQHRQLCHEITYVISGSGYFYTDDQQYLLAPGDIHFVAKGHMHKIVVPRGQNLRFVYLGFNFNEKSDTKELAKLQLSISNCTTYHIRDNGNIRLMLYMLINELYNSSDFNEIMAQSYITQVLIQFYRLINCEKQNAFQPEKVGNIIGEPIFSIINYIDNNITEIESIQNISSVFGYSHSYISHLFKTRMGVTLQQYVTKKKIENSVDLIKTGNYSITEIAFMLHYESVQSFGKAFKKVMGRTPSDVKKELQKNEALEQLL